MEKVTDFRMEDAERVKRVAERTYPPGASLEAIFRAANKKRRIYYSNPRDVPPTVTFRYETYFLWSVRRQK